MSRSQAFVQCAFERVRRLAAGLAPTGRWPLASLMVAGLLASALGISTPVRADDLPVPAARLQIIIKKIHIFNDRDGWGGSGEMRTFVSLCPDTDSKHACEGANGVEAVFGFSADTGDDVYPDRIVPASGDALFGEASIEAGVPVYAGQSYSVLVGMIEEDTFGGDDMGHVSWGIGAGNGWSIGTHTQPGGNDFGGAEHGGVDFEVTYEIRRTPLPDLQIHGFSYVPLDNGGKAICAQIENIGQAASGVTPLTVRVNQTILRQTVVGELQPGKTTGHCVLRSELPARLHVLGFSIDDPRQVAEMDETNNISLLSVPSLPPGAAPSGATDAAPEAAPSPQPTAADAGAPASPESKPGSSKPDSGNGKPGQRGDNPDLAVRAIRVNGQAPDGKDDCKVGKNAVSVVVKNVGKGDAGSFVVALSLDGDSVDATVASLDAGQEQEVRFGDIQLTRGQHALRAIADAERAVAESKEENNEQKGAATCKGDA